MKRKLPASTLRRKKDGLRFPAHEWLRGPLARVCCWTRSPAEPADRAVPARCRCEHCVRQHLDRRANLGYHLWGLMLLLLWMKRWRIQTTHFDTARPVAGKHLYLYLAVLLIAARHLSGLHPFSAFADGRCGRRAGADRAQHADLGRLGDGAPGRRRLPGKIAADLLADRRLLTRFSARSTGPRAFPWRSRAWRWLAHRGVRHVGVRPARRILRGPRAWPPASACSCSRGF